jgi:hypothetical protein
MAILTPNSEAKKKKRKKECRNTETENKLMKARK